MSTQKPLLESRLTRFERRSACGSPPSKRRHAPPCRPFRSSKSPAHGHFPRTHFLDSFQVADHRGVIHLPHRTCPARSSHSSYRRTLDDTTFAIQRMPCPFASIWHLRSLSPASAHLL